MLDKIFKFLLGDDIFISYSRADGATYAAGLANELTKLKFSCKLDQWGTESGAEMPESLKKSLKRSAVLVLVGTDGAAKSRHVASEIKEFKNLRRMVIPIVFDGILLKNGLTYQDGVKQHKDSDTSAIAATEALWAGEIEGLPISWEKLKNLKTGNPLPENVSRIEKTFTFSRKDERLRKTSLAAAIFLLLLLVASGAASVVAFVQTKNAAAATNLAAEKEQIANQKTKDAEEATEKANFEADRALKNEEIANQKTEEARLKTEEAAKASKLADEKTKLADEKTKLADAAEKEAEKQTKLAEEKRIEAEKLDKKSRNLTYATNIQFAARLYDSGRIEPFADVLSGTNTNLRGFEWYYLNHLPEGLVKFDKTGEERITRLMFSPNGEYFVSADTSFPFLLWNPKNGKITKKLESNENLLSYEFVDFIFSPKGERFVALFEKDILIWDTANWKRIKKISNDAKDEKFIWVTFGESPDELLTVSYNGRPEQKYFLRRWNIQTPTQVQDFKEIKLLEDEPFKFEVLKVTPDGKTFVSYRQTRDDLSDQISLLDANLKETKIYKDDEANNESDFAYEYYFSETGKRLAISRSGSRMDSNEKKPTIFVLDIPENKIIMKSADESNVEEGIQSAAFSPDEKKLAVAYSKEVRILDIDKNAVERSIPFIQGAFAVVAFSSDSSKFILKTDEALTLWDVNSNQDVFTFNNEEFIDLSADGARAITANPENGETTLWNTVEKQPIRKLGIHKDDIHKTYFSADGKHFIVQKKEDSEYQIQLRDAANGEEIKLISDTECKFSENREHTIFSGNGKRLATLCKDETVRVWNIENQNGVAAGKELSKLQTKETSERKDDYVVSFEIRFVEGDKKIIIIPSFFLKEENIQIWDVESGMRLHPEVCSEKISGLSPNGEWMITFNGVNYRLRHKENKRCDEKLLVLDGEIRMVTFSNDGRFLAIDYDNNSVRVVNLTKTTARDFIPQQQMKRIYSKFSPSGRWVETGDKYWNTETGESFTVYGCTEMGKFSVDEKRLITSCLDGTLKFWSLESGQEVLTLKADEQFVRDAVLMEENKNLLTVSENNLKLWRTGF